MAVGTESFPKEPVGAATADGQGLSLRVADRSSELATWSEIALVYGLLEIVMWTPRSLGHSLVIASLVVSVLWLGFRGRSTKELGLVWPSGSGTASILAIGCVVAIALPVGAILTGHSVPANPDWPKFKNVWPYVIWAVGQQFLLQSFFYLRLERLLGARAAVLVSTLLFTLLHLPNISLTAMTLLGGLFFTEMFRTYRSVFPLAIAHALMGISVAYSFPDSLMHHMRVGLSFWQFR